MKRIVVALGGVLFLLIHAQANVLVSGAQDYLAAQSATPPSQTGERTQGVANCTHTLYDAKSANLWIVNTCDIPLTVAMTSASGNISGQRDVAANTKAVATSMALGYKPRRDGRVYLFPCPKGYEPVLPNGNPLPARNYKGSFMCARPIA
jgi:hypothetical protein